MKNLYRLKHILNLMGAHLFKRELRRPVQEAEDVWEVLNLGIQYHLSIVGSGKFDFE
jgi:hypothetical protein